ncbi:MAG TPA: hypothetical protein VD816_12750, partial [Ohtaekwangia sp.]|nr:hypothetical protein [Ohtaekwangia sp.]
MKCPITLLGIAGFAVCFSQLLHAQSFTVRPGQWSAPSTWSNAIVPDHSSGEIIINHRVIIPEDTILTIDDVTLNDTLIVARNAVVTMTNAAASVPDLKILAGGLKVFGRIICSDSATFSGTSEANTFFFDGSVYEHRYFNTAGEPPTATWSGLSTLEITGYITGKSLTSVRWN